MAGEGLRKVAQCDLFAAAPEVGGLTAPSGVLHDVSSLDCHDSGCSGDKCPRADGQQGGP
jgi:hypothetical protein